MPITHSHNLHKMCASHAKALTLIGSINNCEFYAIAAATPDLSHICDLHHSSQQHWILNLLSEARDRTHNLMVPSQIC